MKVGIVSYSFHRYFGEIYPRLQSDPQIRWDVINDLIPFAIDQKVQELAIETIYFPVFDDGYCTRIAKLLSDADIEPVLGWGHPDGLHGGTDEAALEDMKRTIPQARLVGGRYMRIVASGPIRPGDVPKPREPKIRNIIRMLSEAAVVAESHGIVLALENHGDLTSEDMLEILEGVGSDYLRVNLDTGNPIRVYEDPVDATRRLAPYTVTTHTKDLTTAGKGGSPAQRLSFFPSCPSGNGFVDLETVADLLHQAGFSGALSVELDLIAKPWEHMAEEDLVKESLVYLRGLAARHAPS